jgi:hypothetical protein
MHSTRLLSLESLPTPGPHLRPPAQVSHRSAHRNKHIEKDRTICGRRDHWIAIINHLLQHLQEAILNTHCRIQIKEFCNADHSCLANVGTFILECFTERFAKVIDHFIDPDAAHRADCQSSYQRIWVFRVLTTVSTQLPQHNMGVDRWRVEGGCYLDERVDGKNT